MIRGTTSTHTFTIPFALATVEKLLVTYTQGGDIVLNKTEKECSLTEDLDLIRTVIRIDLSARETLAFRDGYANVQITILSAGEVYKTDTDFFRVEDTQSEEVLK